MNDNVHKLQSGDTGDVVISCEEFALLLQAAVLNAGFTEDWYLGRHPDVATAVARGDIGSALEHCVSNGYNEGRVLYEIVVDEAYYLANNDDVRQAISLGDLADAQSHFDRSGRAEGRLPYEGYVPFQKRRNNGRGWKAMRAATRFR